MTTQLARTHELETHRVLETPYQPSAELMIRSRSMLLLHENLAKARIHQRLDEAQLVRQARLARTARLRLRKRERSRVAVAASRARVLVAFGSATR